MRWRRLVVMSLALVMCCGCSVRQKQIQNLIGEIKSHDADPDQRETEEKLARFGKDALPQVLREFRKSDSYILKAVPVIQKIATSIPIICEERAHASTALALLNHPLPPRPLSSFLKFDRDSEKHLSQVTTTQIAQVLYATIDQVFHPTTSTLMLTSVKKVGPEKIMDAEVLKDFPENFFSPITLNLVRHIQSAVEHIDFSGGFTSVNGSWSVTVSMFKPKVALITARPYFGPLNSATYLGRAELRNGRWLVVDWVMIFIS